MQTSPVTMLRVDLVPATAWKHCCVWERGWWDSPPEGKRLSQNGKMKNQQSINDQTEGVHMSPHTHPAHERWLFLH